MRSACVVHQPTQGIHQKPASRMSRHLAITQGRCQEYADAMPLRKAGAGRYADAMPLRKAGAGRYADAMPLRKAGAGRYADSGMHLLPPRDTGSVTNIFWWGRGSQADATFYVGTWSTTSDQNAILVTLSDQNVALIAQSDQNVTLIAQSDQNVTLIAQSDQNVTLMALSTQNIILIT
ncbi:hypothetical protein PSHT_08044 [Puccinia striiformis]|uniref:Uncharacterized protein n=1 Tax=Puccinia striiformis TaxID=27350 RepID=A0A2S4VSL8_9BASI|nr:hypothetical protein PSHT_08044 [Puccinia striiformis]